LKRSSELAVPLETGAISALVYPAESPAASLILAHGAGAGQRSAFMVACATGLAACGIEVITFDFAYMAAKRKIPDRGPTLEATYQTVIETVRGELDSARRFLFIGGKSMGGRIATQVAAASRELPVTGLVLLGYPLHPPGRPDTLRAAHLPAVARPMLFVQGSRDSFGTPQELAPILTLLIPAPGIHVVDGGDHSLVITRRDPKKQAAANDVVYGVIARWIKSVIAR
jgi:predicted alpha/beta-hydrolase family hydrolase